MYKLPSKTNTESKIFTDISLTGTEIVVQSNILVDSIKRIKLREIKLFSFIISKINPLQPNNMCFRMSVAEIAKAIGVQTKESVYRDVRSIIRNLMSKIVTIPDTKTGQKNIDVPFLIYAKYWDNEGYVDVEISPHLAPYVLNLHRDFTLYKLSNIMYLSSVYAIRIYEMLKKQEIIGSRTFYLDDLRKKLSAFDKFQAYKDFRIYVLDMAIREINKKTDLQISYIPKKVRQKVIAVTFDIKEKEELQSLPIESIEKRLDNIYNISAMNLQKLLSFGFSLSDASKMLSNITDDETTEAIAAVEEQIRKGKARNEKAMIRTALQKKWKKNIELEEKPKRTSKEPPSENGIISGIISSLAKSLTSKFK